MTLQENLLKLINASKEGKLKWVKINPTTYSWKSTASTGDTITTVLQRIDKSNEQDISFRIVNATTQRITLSISYKESQDDIKNLLLELFKVVAGALPFVEDVFSDILKDF